MIHATRPKRLLILALVTGWLIHFACLLCVGFYQMDMQYFIDTIFNTPLMWLVHSFDSDFSLRYFLTANHMGNGNIAGALMLAIIILAWRMHNTAVISKIICFAVGSSLLAAAAKNIVAATRPILWPSIEHAHGSSFPSSHAMASLGLAFIAGWVLHEQKYVVISWFIFAAAISCGLARVYIGVHRPSDILLSWLIVISWHYWVTRCFTSMNSAIKP